MRTILRKAIRLAPRDQGMRSALVLGLFGLVLLGGCAHHAARDAGPNVSVVVLPKPPDGHVGAVVVRPLDGGKAVLLDKPYVEASMRDTETVRTSPTDAKSVNQAFGQALEALPAQPSLFLVYFVEGTDELNPDARSAIDRIVAEVAVRPSPEIAVVGHTDFVGSDRYNDKLSLQRAERVKALLVKRGIPAKIIQTAGRGKREPVVHAPSTVAEPRNRRVEIIVR